MFIRDATAGDYPAFVRLFPELLVNDAIPGAAIWSSVFAPHTFIAQRGERVLGYAYFDEYENAGYVRNVVVDPAERSRGAGGGALMEAIRIHLRKRGKSVWRLNVRHDNAPALALYRRQGEARSNHGGHALGFCIFDPTFPGAFPLRVIDLRVGATVKDVFVHLAGTL
jgi:ribosomal protein S18 acetylase RimI-like enzyme